MLVLLQEEKFMIWLVSWLIYMRILYFKLQKHFFLCIIYVIILSYKLAMSHFYSLPSAVENLFPGHLRNNIKFAMKIIRWIDCVNFLSIKNICW